MADEATTAPGSAAPATPVTTGASTIAGGGIDLGPARGAISAGAMTHDEAVKHWGLSEAEAAALGTSARGRSPQIAVKGAESELHDIRTARRADPRSYTPDVEKRELGLIEQIQKRATTPSPVSTILSEAMEPLRKIDAELSEIKKARTADFNAYRKDQAAQARELDLLRQREELTGEVTTLENINLVASAVYETTPDQAAFDSAFDQVYAGISEEAQAAMREELGSATPLEPSRPANEAQVAHFGSEPIGAELVAEWGRAAPKKVAMVQARVARMLPNASDRAAMEDWFDSLPPETAKAVIRSIAR